ncbi:MAG: hypothetical protein OEV21_06300, partial [Thermoplasmata archaeon]|nr:hypothetical protein [Thermoplasmata archaeon]
MNMKVMRTKLMATFIVMVMGLAAALVLCQNASATSMPIEQISGMYPLSSPRMFASFFMHGNDQIYVIGGHDNPYTGGNQVDTVLIYDVNTGETTTGTNMPNGTYDSTYAKGLDGRFYIFGGYNGSLFDRHNLTQIYDPDSDSWSTGADCPEIPYATSAATGTDGRIYLFGGYPMTNVTLIYNPVSDSWSYGADLLTPRLGTRSVALNDTSIFVIGGGTTSGAFAVNIVEIYNPVANTWSTADSLNSDRNYAGAVLARNGYIYAISGGDVYYYDEGPALTSIERYDVVADSWSTIGSSLSLGRTHFGVVSDDIGRIFVVGGYLSGLAPPNVTPSIEMLVMSSLEFEDISDIFIVSPTEGSYVTGNVVVLVESKMPIIQLLQVDLYVDGVLYESQPNIFGFTSWTFIWNTSSLVEESVHELTVRGISPLPDIGTIKEDSITVIVSSLSTNERIEQLKQNIADLEAQIAELQDRMMDANES